MNKLNYKQIFLVVAVTTIASEILIYPVDRAYQFSIANAVFMYAVLSLPELLIIPTGSLSALCIFIMGVSLDYFFVFPELPLGVIAKDRFLGVLYFVILAVLLKAGKVKNYSGKPFTFQLARLMVFADLTAKLVEIFFRGNLPNLLSPDYDIVVLVTGSLVQVFLVFGLINISQFKQQRVLNEQEKLRFEKTLIITSNLYDELFFMQKSTENMERIMAESYKLYQKLKSQKDNKELEELALKIAEEVHEVKKDSSRILAGLSKGLNLRKEMKEMYLSEILDLVIKANRNYSQKEGKEIDFTAEITDDFTFKKVHPLLAILNNIVENAVEAISDKGRINIEAGLREAHFQIAISDDGRDINPKDLALIFEPGYTTKFNEEGIPSSGIGLAYVKGLVEDLGGKVEFSQDKGKKYFYLTFPREDIGG
ncbi:MAG TPA: ATP-binding protein [Firmicutes bacterium]|nr:ATP-binding protein [Bacillota bacterium]